jgi:hypothetical protein
MAKDIHAAVPLVLYWLQKIQIAMIEPDSTVIEGPPASSRSVYDVDVVVDPPVAADHAGVRCSTLLSPVPAMMLPGTVAFATPVSSMLSRTWVLYWDAVNTCPATAVIGAVHAMRAS